MQIADEEHRPAASGDDAAPGMPAAASLAHMTPVPGAPPPVPEGAAAAPPPRAGLVARARAWLDTSGPGEAPRRELLAYSLGGFGQGMAAGVMGLTMPILNMTLGVDPGKLGLVRSLKMIWDGVNDPIFGHITDNTKTRWGRRRPYIAVGGVLTGLLSIGMWMMPPGMTETWYLVYFAVAILLIETSSTVFTVPFYALGIELSPSYHGRTRVAAYRGFINGIGGFISPWFLRFCLLSSFGGILYGARWLSLILGSIAMVTAVIAAAVCRERLQADTVRPAKNENFFKAVRGCADNVHFWRVTGIYVIMALGGGLFEMIGGYMSIFYVFRGDMTAASGIGGITGMLGTGMAMIGIPLIARVSRRLGKHGALRCALVLMMTGDLMRWVLFDPRHPWLLLLTPISYSIGISATYTILGSMQADVVDVDEMNSGRRREGMFGAVSAVVMKSASAFAVACSGFILNMTGFDAKLGGAQSEQTYFLLRILFTFGPLAFQGLVLLLLYRYPLTESRMDDIRAELKQRRAAALAAAAETSA
ncbi:MFS transporter [bacterium]|nr:MFS transporter [bacterium]